MILILNTHTCVENEVVIFRSSLPSLSKALRYRLVKILANILKIDTPKKATFGKSRGREKSYTAFVSFGA